MPNGVFCVEGEWESDLRDRKSVLPMLELLERLGEIRFIHRNAATVNEAHRYITTWTQRRYDGYPVLYFAAHGREGEVCWSRRESSTLSQLGQVLAQSVTGYYLYLGSCLTLLDTDQVQQLARDSGARAVLGYRRSVEWLDSAAFDVALLPRIAAAPLSPQALINSLYRRHADLAEHLRFSVVTRWGALTPTSKRPNQT